MSRLTLNKKRVSPEYLYSSLLLSNLVSLHFFKNIWSILATYPINPLKNVPRRAIHFHRIKCEIHVVRCYNISSPEFTEILIILWMLRLHIGQCGDAWFKLNQALKKIIHLHRVNGKWFRNPSQNNKCHFFWLFSIQPHKT